MITVDFKRLHIGEGDRILDIGCGSGRHTCAISLFHGVTTVGVDVNFDEVAETRNRLAYHREVGEHGGGLSMPLCADICNLPFDDNFFDLVICSEVLEHVKNPDKAIDEIIRVLGPRKNLVVSVPRFLPERICWFFSNDYHNEKGGHIRIYKKRALTTLLERGGLHKWAAHFSHSLHTPYWWLKCLVGPSRDDHWSVKLYHRFLVWDMMKHPKLLRLLDNLLNPLIGKSLVLYLRKGENAQNHNLSGDPISAC